MADVFPSRYEEFAEQSEATDMTASEATTSQTTAEAVQAAFGTAIKDISTHLGQTALTLDPASLLDVCRWLRDERDFALLSDVTAQDCGGDPRFFVIIHLRCLSRLELLRLRIGATEKKPKVPSVTPIWPGANFPEREVYDLFGIEFEGHPNLKRIMMPPEWEGHPLRKDYPLFNEPVAFTHNADEIFSKKPFARS
jgi:NADH-quinone oxidoreductase subunit C